MEGGSPTLIWERWTLPMYAAQLRYWTDHPRLDQVMRTVHAKKGSRPGYTPPESAPDVPMRPLDWSLLDKPPGGKA